MVKPLRHRQTKGAATDMFYLTPPRHISTLPSASRLSTATVSMSLTGSCFSSESAPRPLYGVFFVKEFARAAKLSFVGFLVRSQSPFLRPDPRIADVDARRICTRLAVTPILRHASPLPGHTLTASSTSAR